MRSLRPLVPLFSMIFAAMVVIAVAIALVGPEEKDQKDAKPPAAKRLYGATGPTVKAVRLAQAAAVEDCPAHSVVNHQVVHEMGDCAPPSQKEASRRAFAGRPVKGTSKEGPDLSNNNPVYDQARIRAHGHVYEYLKVSEGTSFTDRTAARMAANAKAAGIYVGGYHFAHVCLTSPWAEAQWFTKLIRSAGLTGPGTLRPALDVEYGGCRTQSATASWIRALRHAVVQELGTEVAIYSGNWWLAPKAGCFFKTVPPSVVSWISGYPNATPPCGRKEIDLHQFCDRCYNGAINGDMNRLVATSLSDLKAGSSSPPASDHAVELCEELIGIRHYVRDKGDGWAKHPKRKERADKIKRALAKDKERSGYPGKWHYECSESHDPHCYTLPA